MRAVIDGLKYDTSTATEIGNYSNMTAGGDGIIAMTTDEAREWCEIHEIDVDTISEHFEVKDA